MKTLFTDRRVMTRLQVTEGQAEIRYRLVGRNVPRFIWSDRPMAVPETTLYSVRSESVTEELGTLPLFLIVIKLASLVHKKKIVLNFKKVF